MNSLREQVAENDVRLNVISLDFANEHGEEEDSDDDEEMRQSKEYPPETQNQQYNKKILVDLTEKTKGALFPATVAMEIYKQFKKREVMARSKYRGNLDISQDCKLAVNIFARTKEESFPSLKKYSKVVEDNSALEAGKVTVDRQYTEVDDTDQKPVGSDQQRKAFFYGK